MDEFELELKNGFLEEATQLQSEVEQCFLSLEANPEDHTILEKIFRLAHNIKGSSKAVGFSELGAFTHEFESFILKLKNGEIKIDHRAVDLLLAGNDHLRQYFEALKADLNAVLDSRTLVANFLSFRNEALAANPEPSPLELAGIPDAAAFADEAFVSAEAPPLSADLTEFSAITEAHLPVGEPIADKPAGLPPPVAKAAKAPAGADESIRVSLGRVEKLIDFVGEAVIMQTMLKELSLSGSPALRRSVHHLGKVIKEVQDLSMGLRMLPIKGTFQKMQRIVRDTSSLLNKQVHLELEGEETEIDKTVLESLGDPLVHMVRNGVDHGIEMPEARLAAGKPAAGTIRLRAFHQSGRLVIEIRDDGAGISASRLRKKAVEKGILSETAAANLSEQDAIHLIFHPGFSTKAEVTEVSGRGVGMDVVKTNIESLQGEVNVTTVEGKGSLFRISLPLTLAIIDGMIVRSGNQRYVVPLNHVHESLKPGPKDLHKTTGVGEMLLLRGENLPVFRLSKVLGAKPSDSEQIAIIVRNDAKPFAFLVDDILGQHQVVIKKMGAELASLKGFSGSAILGDGRPALILEMPELIREKGAA
ncbi:MAG: chemotaxis protein CheA [Proteobacteria bacterium]|nr:MAG: chemotaxis protein CheA [Pseudomonadota bacterium]